jgi:hypothetical protein
LNELGARSSGNNAGSSEEEAELHLEGS